MTNTYNNSKASIDPFNLIWGWFNNVFLLYIFLMETKLFDACKIIECVSDSCNWAVIFKRVYVDLDPFRKNHSFWFLASSSTFYENYNSQSLTILQIIHFFYHHVSSFSHHLSTKIDLFFSCKRLLMWDMLFLNTKYNG